jgi:hypothetical protein
LRLTRRLQQPWCSCAELQLFRDYRHGPLAGLALTPDTLNALLSEARLAARAHLDSVGPDGRSAHVLGPPTTFIGRENDVENVTRLVRSARLLTLTGPGGVGKSRLAVEVARRVRNDFANGIILVELASVSDPALLLPKVVANSLGVPERPGTSVLASVIEAIRPLQLLLTRPRRTSGCRRILT